MTKINITIPVDASSLSLSAEQIVAQLTPEQRSEVALQLYRDWFKIAEPVQRAERERAVIAEIRKESSRYSFGSSGREKTDDEIRKEYDFRRKMDDYKTPHDVFVAEATKKVQEVLRVEADRAIAQDSAIQALREKMLADLPEMLMVALKDAAQRWATSQLQQLAYVFQQMPLKSQG